MWRGWGEHISMIWVGGIYRAPVLHGSGSKLDPYFSYYWKQGENKAGLTDKKLTILIGEFSSGAIIFVLLKEMFKLKIAIFKFAHTLFKINNVTVWKRLGSGSKYLRIRIPALCQFFYHTGEVPVPLYATADGSFVLTENIFPFLTLGLLYLFTNPSLATANLLFK